MTWIPSIAAGDLSCFKSDLSSDKFELWMATLRDKSLRRILVSPDGKAIYDERIPIGSRVRDLIVEKDSNLLLLLTDDGQVIEMIHESY